MAKQKKLIVIGGPTASGKTKTAIQLAQRLNCEIFSADSRQVYKELNIGVAKPSELELSTVKHHLISYVSIHDAYDAATYERDARELLNHYFLSSDVAILVGGTGLYINALLEGLDRFPHVGKDVISDLEEELQAKGIQSLTERLRIKDPATYNTIDLHNSRRVIRALSVSLVSKQPYSSFLSKKSVSNVFDSYKYYLHPDRSKLYEKINLRVDEMVSEGLLEEVRSLYPFKHLKPLQTIGYKELFQYLDNTCSLDYAVTKIKQHSRNYAKRQLTWFKNNYNGQEITESNVQEIISILTKSL